MKGLPKKIEVKIKKVVHREGDPFLFILWKFLIDGKPQRRDYETHFPFSMS